VVDWQNVATWYVLIVDDEPANRAVFADTLQYFGAKVATASNGLEALQIIHTQAPTLVLTDLAMPKLDGWELLRALRADPALRHIPILAVTAAFTMPGDRERVLAAGFNGYLAKPIDIVGLVDIIRSAVQDTNAEQGA
jgi:CheY-like chemotaxis protein